MSTTTYTPNYTGIPKVGDILVSTWGHEACLANFYKVVKVSPSGKSVTVKELDQIQTGDWVAGTAAPVLDKEPTGEAMTKKIRSNGQGYSFKRNEYSSAWVWSGKPVDTYNHH
jgi:hypothetical protein